MRLNLKDRILVMLSSVFYATLGFFFTGSFLWYLILVVALIYVVVGGKKHV